MESGCPDLSLNFTLVLAIFSEGLCASMSSSVKWASGNCFEVYEGNSIKAVST